MKISELIEKLNKFDPEFEVFISDGAGYDCCYYPTDRIKIREVAESQSPLPKGRGLVGKNLTNSEQPRFLHALKGMVSLRETR